MSLVLDPSEDQLVTWSSPAERLWVASTPTAYLGMVEHADEGFIATGATSELLGVHDSLQRARLAVYSAR
jgi:hypothetical protein